MRNSSKILGLGCYILALGFYRQILADPEVQVVRNLTLTPLAFTENQGQWDREVLFRAGAGGATLWFTKDGAIYQFTRKISTGYDVVDDPMDPKSQLRRNKPNHVEAIAIEASFIGANSNPQLVGLDMMEYKCNFFIGNDSDEWCTDVPNYKVIVYREIYTGIDLKYYGNGKQMEYDFIVSAGADPSQIAIRYSGANSVSVNDNGELTVETDWGLVIERKPLVYQVVNGQNIPIECAYSLKAENTFGFELDGSYNRQYALVIDPILEYSTYLGGSDWEYCYGIDVDEVGAAYVTGTTWSSNFPTVGGYQTCQDSSDVFVSKLSHSGNSLIYSTYLGGNHHDCGHDIKVDNSGAAYVTGFTMSSDFPMQNPYDDINSIGGYDAFVTKLGPAGNSLSYSTYLGGVGTENGYSDGSIAIDDNGCAYVTGETSSSDFPTQNAYDDTLGLRDAFVTKLSANGDALIYSTYLGGDREELGSGIAVDNDGCAYVTGWTRSSNFDTANAYQETYGGNEVFDAFVTKFNSGGDSLMYSTYLGGSNEDRGQDIAVDNDGYAYVAGITQSDDFPTENPYSSNHNGGSWDAFVTKVGLSGDALVFSTYLGGSNVDYGYGISVNSNACAYVTGETHSDDFPLEGSIQGFQGFCDAFVTKFASDGTYIHCSTYIGGTDYDYGVSISVDHDENAYVTGTTLSDDFPMENSYDDTLDGEIDAYIFKINFETTPSRPRGFCGSPIRCGPPEQPDSLICGLHLHWNRNPESYVSYYKIYKGYGEDFVTSPANPLCSTTDTFYTDPDWRWIPDLCYKLFAVTFYDSLSLYALVTVDSMCCCDPYSGDETRNVPKSYYLAQNYPNPFNPTTTIRFDLPSSEHVKLCVYNAKGELVTTLVDRHMTEGRKEIVWTATSDQGNAVASGIYFYRLVAGDFIKTRKMVLLR